MCFQTATGQAFSSVTVREWARWVSIYFSGAVSLCYHGTVAIHWVKPYDEDVGIHFADVAFQVFQPKYPHYQLSTLHVRFNIGEIFAYRRQQYCAMAMLHTVLN